MKFRLRALFLVLIIQVSVAKNLPAKNYNFASMPADKTRVVEDSLFGLPEHRLMAIRECGLGRLYICYRALISNLNDPDDSIRDASAQALGVLGLAEALPKLQEALTTEKNAEIRGTLIWAIGFIHDPKGAAVIEPYLKDENPVLRRYAAIALGAINNPASTAALNTAMQSEKLDRVKVEMVRSLLILNPDTKTKDQMIGFLRSDEKWVRYYAAEAIRELRIKDAHQPLQRALLVEDDQEVREKLYRAYLTTVYEY